MSGLVRAVSLYLGPAALVSSLAATAIAQSKPAPPAPRPPAPGASPPPPPGGPKPAIARIAESLARDLEGAAARALVVASPPVADTPAPRGAQLAAALAAQLAGRRGKGTRAHAEPAPLAAARELARAESALVYLTVEIAGGQLKVSADVYPVPGTVWSRLRDPSPGPRAHAFAQSPLDAEIRGYLAPIPLTSASVERGKNFESDVVALACGDLDDDGAPEIVSVSRRRVTALRLKGGKVQILASRNWPDLAGVNPAPYREPIAFATLVPRGQDGDGPVLLDVGLTDRAKSVRLDGKLQIAGAFAGIAVPDAEGSACTRMWGLTVTGPLVPCSDGDPEVAAASVGGQYDAFASARLFAPGGAPFAVWAGREARVLEVRDDAGHRATLDSAGAQIAVGDLEQDGDPEIISSLDVANPLDDAVVVRSWPRLAPGGKPVERLRIPAAAGVHAIAVCPPDGPGRAPFAVATTDEIWVVR